MKNIITITFLVAATVLSAVGQSKEQQEVLQFNAAYEKAQLDRDVAFFERVFADDYTFSGPTAEVEDKAKALAWIRSEKAKPTYKMVSIKSENVKAKVMGNMAILTGDWIGTSMSATDAQSVPHTDRGRYTAFLEKRNGQWVVLAEHVSEAQHDRKLMEQEILNASNSYGAALKNRDKSAFERLLADDYMFTNEEGKTRNKAEDIAMMTSPDTAFESAEVSDRKIRVLSNASAVETGTWRAKGTNKGKAFDETGRYTTTWVWRGGRWQVAADHSSDIR
ncbi:hypothetical protein BH24ACI3_BH24ACI3_04420 [soil metagenome]